MAHLGSALGRRSRQIGTVQEAAALAWVGRWEYSSSQALAVLTNRQVQPRLIRAGLLQRELLRNPYAYVHSLAMITEKGIEHLASLLEKIRVPGFLRDEAIARGFSALLLDDTHPAIRPAKRVRVTTLEHDVLLQERIALEIREQGESWGTENPALPGFQRMLTMRELLRVPRRPGTRVADCVLLRPSATRDDAWVRVYVELENSAKGTMEKDYCCCAWKHQLREEHELRILCTGEAFARSWRAALAREKVPLTSRSPTGRLRRHPTEHKSIALFPSSQVSIEVVTPEELRAALARPPRRASEMPQEELDQAVQARLANELDVQTWDAEHAWEDDVLAEWEDTAQPDHTWRRR